MGVGLFGFIFKTIRGRANDPKNGKFWLPAKLEEIDNPSGPGKLLPLQGKNWDLGDVTGPSGSDVSLVITTQWWTVKTIDDPDPFADMMPIACPDRPSPHLTLPQATILGLDNVWVEDNPTIESNSTGYTATIAVRFGYYDQKSYPQLGPLTIEATWTLEQCVCAALKSAPAACTDMRDTVDGKGPVTVKLTDIYADALVDIRISGSGAQRAISLTVEKIQIRGIPPNPNPTVTITKLDFSTSEGRMVKNEWLKAARRALTDPNSVSAMMGNVNAELNKPGSLAKLAETLQGKLASIIDDTLGSVPAGQLPSGQQAPNPVDQYLFDRARFALNNPASQIYVPRIILGINDPKLEPDNIDSIDLGSQSVEGIAFNNLKLTQAVITGISNAATPANQMIFHQDAGNVDVTVALSSLSPPPLVAVGGRNIQVPAPPLRISSNFSFTVEDDPTVNPGSIVITIDGAQIATTIHFSGPDAATLTITFTSIHLAAKPAAIKVTLSLDASLLDVINQVVNAPTVKQKVLDGINQRAAGHLDKLSKAATDKVREVIAQKLDG